MVTWGDYARDLRILAGTIEVLADKLPLPRFPDQGIGIEVHVANALDVLAASQSLGLDLEESRGHTKVGVDVGTVHLRFIHVSDESRAEYAARTSYGENLRVTS